MGILNIIEILFQIVILSLNQSIPIKSSQTFGNDSEKNKKTYYILITHGICCHFYFNYYEGQISGDCLSLLRHLLLNEDTQPLAGR